MNDEKDDAGSSESATAIERPKPKTDGQGTSSLPPGTVLASRYEVRGTIGRGGMGLVVEAFDRTLGVAVAIKIVRAELAGEREWSERLAREVKLARQIQHPNVCRVFDFAQTDGRAFLIMELATGGTLRDETRAAKTRARPLGDRISDARALAAGLAAIHAAGIVHRDISPQNALRMSDGRLVLSDFGLATDAFDGSTSIHGGTVAYMAPEVLRGGRANVAADVWSLGAVIHEVVFGERLQWNPQTAEMRSSVGGRRLSPLEQSVFEICRACLAADPARRPAGAAEIAARLSDVGLARSAGRRRHRRVAVAVAAAGVAAMAVVGAKRVETSRKNAARAVVAAEAAPADPLMIIPTGEPEDWTDKSKVLAEIPDRVRCMVRLPDRHTVRLVWGYPAHAEDIDTRTGKRSPSPLVPDAYAEGCPDVSSDGKRLVYTGHTADDRAFAFVSTHPDGSAAVPVVPIAEPSMTSDPTWLPDGTRFLYEVDARHLALFSVATNRSLILPSQDGPFSSSFHSVLGAHVYAISEFGNMTADVRGFSPAFDEIVHFRLPFLTIGIDGEDDSRLYCSTGMTRVGTPLIEVRPSEKRARRIGFVPGQYSRYPRFVENGMAFLSRSQAAEIVQVTSSGAVVRLPVGPEITTASSCGPEFVATRIAEGRPTLVRLGANGEVKGPLTPWRSGEEPICSPDGRVLYYITIAPQVGLQRCEAQRCEEIVKGMLGGISMSPGGDRIAFVESRNGGLSYRWTRADGRGNAHQIAEAAAECTPVWTSNVDVWFASRSGRRVIWTEFDVETGALTGRMRPGSHDCSDGVPDPMAPFRAGSELEYQFRSQLRFLPSRYLPAGD